METNNIHDPDFDCDIVSGSDGLTLTDEVIPWGPVAGIISEFESSKYRLSPLLPSRLETEHIPLISFSHPLAYPNTETKMCIKRPRISLNNED